MPPLPGDILLVRTDHLVSRLIRLGQRIGGYTREESRWNHVAVCVGGGQIVEALTHGVERTDVARYRPEQLCEVYAIPHATSIAAADDMRQNAVRFALSCVGERYGFLTILAVAVKALTGGRLDFGLSGTHICSGLAARSLERLGYVFEPWDPEELTPAYLARVLP